MCPRGEPVLEDRIADMAMAPSRGDLDTVLAWLRALGCTAVQVDGVTERAPSTRAATIDGLAGVRVGLTAADPISCAVQLGFALSGPRWPQVYPALLPPTDARWRRQRSPSA